MLNILFYCTLDFIRSKASTALHTLKVKHCSAGTDVQVHLARDHPEVVVAEKDKTATLAWSVLIIKKYIGCNIPLCSHSASLCKYFTYDIYAFKGFPLIQVPKGQHALLRSWDDEICSSTQNMFASYEPDDCAHGVQATSKNSDRWKMQTTKCLPLGYNDTVLPAILNSDL